MIHVRLVDAKNAVLGRMSSMVAKALLEGETVVIVNADKTIITGDPKIIIDKYLERRRRGSPQHGPFFPKNPDLIVHRTVRSMLPYKTNKGRAALRRLKVFAGLPEQFKNEKPESMATKPVRSNFTTVGKVATIIGWHKTGK